MKKRFFDGTDERHGLGDRKSSHIGGSCGLYEVAQIEGPVGISFLGGGSSGSFRCCRCHLPSGHPIDHIVRADHFEIDISPRRMDEMVSANGGEIAIPADHHDTKIRVVEFSSSGKGQSPSMEGMEGVTIEVGAWNPSCTTDARDEKHLLHIHS